MVLLVKLPANQIVMVNGVVMQSWIIVRFVYLDQQENQNVFQIVMVIGAEPPLRIIVKIVLMGKPVNLPALKIATAIGVVQQHMMFVEFVMKTLQMTALQIVMVNGVVMQS